MEYVKHALIEGLCICTDCGSFVHADYVGKHDQWHLNVLRGSLKK